MAEPTKAVCARCGHQAGGCPRCGRNDRLLGGYIEGERYCHTFSEQPSCYTLRCRERHDALMASHEARTGQERPHGR